jgi:hypothetical protein
MTADSDEDKIQIGETQPTNSQIPSVPKRRSIEELELEGEMFLKGLFDKLDTIALFLFSGGVALFSVINYISSKLQSDNYLTGPVILVIIGAVLGSYKWVQDQYIKDMLKVIERYLDNAIEKQETKLETKLEKLETKLEKGQSELETKLETKLSAVNTSLNAILNELQYQRGVRDGKDSTNKNS